MYLEKLKKLAVLKELIERNLINKGEYPNKKYINYLLKDIDTRYCLLDHNDVSTQDEFDTDAFNLDLYYIKKDLDILYSIVSEIADKKYIELESFVNGYLLSLETMADRADKKTQYDLEATSLGADIVYFKDTPPSIAYDNMTATISLGSISFEPLSKILCYINGSGFELKNAVFDFGDGKRVSPYPVNKDTLKNGGKVKRNVYKYNLDSTENIGTAFKLAISNFTADIDNSYEIYGGASKIQTTYGLMDYTNKSVMYDKDHRSGSITHYSFYLMNARKIQFDFSAATRYQNFSGSEITDMSGNEVRYIEFWLDATTQFSFDTDGTIYATKETPEVSGKNLYVQSITKAKDFIIFEYAAGDKVTYNNVKLKIYDVEEAGLHIDSIAIKQISDMQNGADT